MTPTRSLTNSDLYDVNDINLAYPGFVVSAQVGMLIGSDILPSIVQRYKKIIMIAQNSIYDWYIYGPITNDSTDLAPVNMCSKTKHDSKKYCCGNVASGLLYDQNFKKSVNSFQMRHRTIERMDGKELNFPFLSNIMEI